MLDHDPNGDYHKTGIGTAANMAIAFQALGLQLIEQSALSLQNKQAIAVCLNQMMLDTAVAQQKDVFGEINSEKDYWDKISAKTPPLFSSALFCGAIYGGVSIPQARKIAQLGMAIGKIIQISDDLSDIYQERVEPDWAAPRNNLALLYCMEAEYELKPDFIRLIGQINEEGVLKQAQQIVTSSGALSYCIYHILALYKELDKQIMQLELPRRDKLESMASGLIDPSLELIKLTGVEDPRQFLQMEFNTFR
jgi:geranylgeranyl pyrophosphate synthase